MQVYLENKKRLPRGEPSTQTSQEGFEPPTVRLEGACSIQLSYWDKSEKQNRN